MHTYIRIYTYIYIYIISGPRDPGRSLPPQPSSPVGKVSLSLPLVFPPSPSLPGAC